MPAALEGCRRFLLARGPPERAVIEGPGMTTSALTHPTPDPELLVRLTDLRTAHERQLDELPESGLDAVTSARRARTERDLQGVRVALTQLAEGRYGICTGCRQPIAPARLELRCWSTTCVGCADRA